MDTVPHGVQGSDRHTWTRKQNMKFGRDQLVVFFIVFLLLRIVNSEPDAFPASTLPLSCMPDLKGLVFSFSFLFIQIQILYLKLELIRKYGRARVSYNYMKINTSSVSDNKNVEIKENESKHSTEKIINRREVTDSRRTVCLSVLGKVFQVPHSALLQTPPTPQLSGRLGQWEGIKAKKGLSLSLLLPCPPFPEFPLAAAGDP